jgi:hypothetical protein
MFLRNFASKKIAFLGVPKLETVQIYKQLISAGTIPLLLPMNISSYFYMRLMGSHEIQTAIQHHEYPEFKKGCYDIAVSVIPYSAFTYSDEVLPFNGIDLDTDAMHYILEPQTIKEETKFNEIIENSSSILKPFNEVAFCLQGNSTHWIFDALAAVKLGKNITFYDSIEKIPAKSETSNILFTDFKLNLKEEEKSRCIKQFEKIVSDRVLKEDERVKHIAKPDQFILNRVVSNSVAYTELDNRIPHANKGLQLPTEKPLVKDKMKPDWNFYKQIPIRLLRKRKGSKGQIYLTDKSQVSAFYRPKFFKKTGRKSRAVIRK